MTFTWNPRVFTDAQRMASMGLRAATIYVSNCVKEILSVPAPRVRFTDKTGAKFYKAGFKLKDKNRQTPAGNFDINRASIVNERDYRFPKGMVGPPQANMVKYQTAPAIKGEPPRKLSGRLRQSIAYEFLNPMKTFEGGDIETTGRVGVYAPAGKPLKYARRLEFGPGDHGFLARTFKERQAEIAQVLYDNAGGSAI